MRNSNRKRILPLKRQNRCAVNVLQETFTASARHSCLAVANLLANTIKLVLDKPPGNIIEGTIICGFVFVRGGICEKTFT